MSDDVQVVIEALLVGSEAEELNFWGGITAEELKKSNRGRVIVENFIMAIEGSTVPLDIGLLAYEDDNGGVFMVRQTDIRSPCGVIVIIKL